jgi:hypothetical protein
MMVALRFPRSLALTLVLCGALTAVHCSSSNPSGFGNGIDGQDGGGSILPNLGGDGSAADAARVYDKCKVAPDEENGGGLECTQSSPPDAFTPVLKWSWKAPDTAGIQGSIVLPLVANLTDDNGDGKVDLCDTPDVLVTVGGGGPGASGKIYMLSGKDGAVEIVFDGNVDGSVTPALGDIDGDGTIEIVANDTAGHLVAYDNKGKVKWVGADVGFHRTQTASYCHAISLYDLDGDGKSEIISAFEVYDNTGKRLFSHDVSAFQSQYWCPANIAADLDGDGQLEVIFGNAAYRANGQRLWSIPGPPGQPQVANLDADPDPEIFVARYDGILVLEHTGAIKYGPINLTGEGISPNCWSKPGAVHDFDGDGIADLSASTCTKYGVYKVGASGLTLNWAATVDDTSGLASTTAFDFLGRGIAQAVYGDQRNLYVFDGKTGAVNLKQGRSSGTLIEYPVVADVDNDQSADIVVVSNSTGGVGTYTNTVDVWQDAQKRWIPTRRIWNQHAYHVTNVREDGTIPRKMTKSWTRLNTFRTNAQIKEGGDCAPPAPNRPK